MQNAAKKTNKDTEKLAETFLMIFFVKFLLDIDNIFYT